MQKTILIVEDEKELRDFLKKILVANNFKVAEAADGAEALEAVEKYLPDLVLLDFGLPKVSGETVCVKIKKDHPEIFVIVLTGKTGSSDVVHGLQIGADDYISKPFVAEELIARIDAKFKTVVNGQVAPKTEIPVAEIAQEINLDKIILRESIVLIIIRIILTEAILGFLLLLFSILYSYINSYFNSRELSMLYIIVLGLWLLVNIGMVLSIAIKWSSQFTEISKEGIVKYSGIFHKKEQKYICNFIEAATLNRSFLGLLFNYGTIELYDPVLKEQVYLSDISSPKKISEKIQKIFLKKNSQPLPFLAKQID